MPCSCLYCTTAMHLPIPSCAANLQSPKHIQYTGHTSTAKSRPSMCPRSDPASQCNAATSGRLFPSFSDIVTASASCAPAAAGFACCACRPFLLTVRNPPGFDLGGQDGNLDFGRACIGSDSLRGCCFVRLWADDACFIGTRPTQRWGLGGKYFVGLVASKCLDTT